MLLNSKAKRNIGETKLTDLLSSNLLTFAQLKSNNTTKRETMVIQDSEVSEVKWIGSHDPSIQVPHLLHKDVCFYHKCIFGPLTLRVGDYVLVLKAGATDPDTVAGCDIAKLIHLYELNEMTDKYPYRAVVQWYSRPHCIPEKLFDDDDISIDFDTELIEEHRPYDWDISLETIYRKCSVICATPDQNSVALMHQYNSKRRNCPMFVCRYKFVKVKKIYRLVPLQLSHSDSVVGDTIAEQVKHRVRRKSSVEDTPIFTPKKGGSARKPRRAAEVGAKRRRASVAAGNAVEFIDINYFSKENKVSPIKIVGGRSVVRASVSAKKQPTPASASIGQKAEANANYLLASPLGEQNTKITPKSRAAAARRNLNLSLDKEADSTAGSDCLNYSIVRNSEQSGEPQNDMKIKLRLSERRHSTRMLPLEEDLLAIDKTHDSMLVQHQRKRLGTVDSSTPNNQDIYHTPSKRTKDAEDTTEMTPSTNNRRKSILKSTTSRVADGTPRRSIQLSNIVERRIFQDDEIISTPKGSRTKYASNKNDDDWTTGMEFQQKTPSRGRRSSTTKQQDTPTTKKALTPSQKLKQIRSGEISPTIKQRYPVTSAVSPANRRTELQLARERLHVSVVPESLPCREKEFDNIYTFLEGKIEDQCGGCMYVSGVPGTGKTATVTGVIRKLQQRAAADELPPFDYIEINGMRLTEPRQAYVQIYKQLTGKTVSWEHAHSLLEKRFTTPAPRRVTTVLLVDELDILCNRRQDVVYNLLDWPTKAAARIAVITIANTMDLPERLLMGKVTSRLGLTRLTFQPYTHKQLQEIVSGRLGGSEAFKSDAVQLVARKVAAVSGDARRALDICRRATEIADAAAQTPTAANVSPLCVNMAHVQHALAEMIASAKVQAIKKCSRLEQIFLQAVVAEVTRTGVEETVFSGVYAQIETIAAFMGAVVPAPGRALRICSKLGAERLLICEHSRADIFQKILLNVSMDDIHYALRVDNNNSA